MDDGIPKLAVVIQDIGIFADDLAAAAAELDRLCKGNVACGMQDSLHALFNNGKSIQKTIDVAAFGKHFGHRNSLRKKRFLFIGFDNLREIGYRQDPDGSFARFPGFRNQDCQQVMTVPHLTHEGKQCTLRFAVSVCKEYGVFCIVRIHDIFYRCIGTRMSHAPVGK